MFIDAFCDPVDAFAAVWDRVRDTAPDGVDPAAVALATADRGGYPAVRMVLLRRADREGFVFFTNYGSRKARELDAVPRAAMCGHWFWVRQQVRIEGKVVRVSASESDAYFATRPRGSQLGAWASRQSTAITSRVVLESRLREAEARFAAGAVPRPTFWGGYRIVPDRLEFWEEGAFRLHDRVAFTKQGDGWERVRLAP